MRKADWTPTPKQLANPKNAIRNLNQARYHLKQDNKALRNQLKEVIELIDSRTPGPLICCNAQAEPGKPKSLTERLVNWLRG